MSWVEQLHTWLDIIGVVIAAVIAVRGQQIIMYLIDRGKLIRDLDITRERVKERDERIGELNAALGTARTTSDGYRDEMARLTGRIEQLDTHVQDLTARFEAFMHKYVAAICYIVNPDGPVPDTIAIDVEHERFRLKNISPIQ